LCVALVAAVSTSCSAAETDGTSFLWRVSSGGRSVALLGSIHFMKQDAYPLSPVIEAAYENAEIVAFETDIEGLEAAAVSLLSAGTLDGEATLADVISPEVHDAVSEKIVGLGMDTSAFEKMKPWMVALSLTSLELMKAGYLGSEGIDAYFSGRAESDGKGRLALETIEFQVGLFAGMSAEESEEFLHYTLLELETVIPLVDEIVAAWSAGDADRIAALLTDGFDEHEELFRRLVTERNLRWFPQIEELLHGDTDALVVVGALHLVGEQGLVELLRTKGYEVEQL
jgi:uncharacterized protein YbaP (TraB family)